MSALNGLDLQALAATGQYPAQSLATFQAAALGRSTAKSGISMPIIDQRNIFSFESPKLRFGEGQQQQLSNNNKQINLLHGIPTNMEPKQLANLQQSSFRGMNMQNNSHGSQSSPLLVQMAQTQSCAQIQQSSLSNGMASGILARNTMVDNGRGNLYNSVSQTSSMVDFSVTQNMELPGNSFPLVSNSGMSTITSKGALQEEVTSEMKEPRGFAPGYDIFSELNQHNSQDWQLQNVGLAFDASQQASIQGSLDVPPSVLTHQGFTSRHNGVQNRNTSIGKVMFSTGEESGNGNGRNIGQQLNSFFTDNSLRVKAERLPDVSLPNSLFPEPYTQEDLMSALLKQQEGIGPCSNEFGFDGFPLDNLPV